MQLLKPSPGGKAPYGLPAIAARKVLLWVILFGWAFSLGYFAGTYSSHEEELSLRSAVTTAAPFPAPDGEVIVLRENLHNLTRIIEDLKTENERYGRRTLLCVWRKGLPMLLVCKKSQLAPGRKLLREFPVLLPKPPQISTCAEFGACQKRIHLRSLH